MQSRVIVGCQIDRFCSNLAPRLTHWLDQEVGRSCFERAPFCLLGGISRQDHDWQKSLREEPKYFEFPTRLRECLDPAEQIFLARHAGDLITELAVLKEEQRRNRADVVLE